MPEKIIGHYEAFACVHDTYGEYREGSASCLKGMNGALAREEARGARCVVQTDHFIHPGTGNFLTLWSVLCRGEAPKVVERPSVAPLNTADTGGQVRGPVSSE
ncbi:MAG: hypothetical protein HQM16_16740 [Deltaproteobacteria bacterium]|nr:hypothetical protein [Deltaproteobacteria bacterium]